MVQKNQGDENWIYKAKVKILNGFYSGICGRLTNFKGNVRSAGANNIDKLYDVELNDGERIEELKEDMELI